MSERQEEDVKGKRQREKQESQGETTFEKIWKMALPSFDSDAELVQYRCCSREAGAKERRAEVPEIIVVSDAVEGTFVNRESGSGQQELIGMK